MYTVLRRAARAIPLVMLICAAAPPAHAADATSMPSPSFVLKDLDGKTLKYSDLKGHPVVLDFWATWCQPCRSAMPHLDVIQDRYAAKGLVVVGVSVDDGSPQRVKRFVDHLGVKFRMAMADEKVL